MCCSHACPQDASTSGLHLGDEARHFGNRQLGCQSRAARRQLAEHGLEHRLQLGRRSLPAVLLGGHVLHGGGQEEVCAPRNAQAAVEDGFAVRRVPLHAAQDVAAAELALLQQAPVPVPIQHVPVLLQLEVEHLEGNRGLDAAPCVDICQHGDLLPRNHARRPRDAALLLNRRARGGPDVGLQQEQHRRKHGGSARRARHCALIRGLHPAARPHPRAGPGRRPPASGLLRAESGQY